MSTQYDLTHEQKSLLVCATCLSFNRKMYTLRSLEIPAIFCKIFEMPNNNPNICWECKHILNKMETFRNKSIKSQKILKDMIKNSQPLTRLSTQSSLTTISLSTIYIDVDTGQMKEANMPYIKSEPDLDIKYEKEDIYESEVERCSDDMELQTVYLKDPNLQNTKVDNDELQVDDKGKKTANKISKQDQEKCFTMFRIDHKTLMRMINEKKNCPRFVKAKHKCVDCLIVFHRDEMLKKHMKSIHESKGKLTCEFCNRKFNKESIYKLHYKNHFKYYKCTECELKSLTAKNVVKHYQRMHQQKPSECRHCGTAFETLRELNNHYKAKHKEKFKCQFCEKMFASASYRRKHELIHTGMPMIECEKCNKQYRGEWGLKAHMRTHDDAKDESAYCAECDRQFRNKYQYNAHLKTSLKHITKEDMRFKCAHCDKPFQSKYAMKNHIEAMHTDVLSYSCDSCDMVFKSRILLRKHKRKVHLGIENPRRFFCHMCPKAFKHKLTLAQHVNAHTGARPYACALCSSAFAHSGALHTHVRLIHQRAKRPSRPAAKP